MFDYVILIVFMKEVGHGKIINKPTILITSYKIKHGDRSFRKWNITVSSQKYWRKYSN